MNFRISFKISLIIISFLLTSLFSQDYKEDSLAVRAILDSNGLFNLNVDQVANKDSGRITSLSIWNYNLKKIPIQIGKLTALTFLNFSKNELNSLPPEIGNLIMLGDFKLHNNKISYLPPEIGSLSNLWRLELDSNLLETFPPELWNCSNLTEFGALYNRLKTIPDGIENTKLGEHSYACFCFNDSLTFTEKQKEFFDVFDYETYFNKYCAVEISKDPLDNIDKKPYNIKILSNKITYTLQSVCKVLISIFNMHGRLIETLKNCEESSGNYSIKWDRNNYSSGVYYIRFNVNQNTSVYKFVITK